MAYLVPNATDTGNAARFADANQAEPDSLDLEALGLRSNWVRDGGVVAVTGTSAITVTAGTVVIQNRPYSFSALTGGSAVTIASALTSRSRFDAVVARLSNGTVSVVVVSGADSATNPTLPRSRSVLATGVEFNPNIHVDPDTDVLLATVYKVESNNLSSGSVVDKRIFSASTTTWTQSSVPTDSTVGKIGDTVIVSSTGSVYMKIKDSGTGRWKEISQSDTVADYVLPIGAIFAWGGSKDDPPNSVTSGTVRFKQCNGQSLSIASYQELYEVIGDTYGGASPNFNLPNITGNTVISGVTRGNDQYGQVVGNNTVTLSADNLPAHNHDPHSHGIRFQNNSTPGGSNRALAANTSVGTEDTNTNTQSTQLPTFGKNTPDPIDVRGKRINLSYYIRVK